MPTMVTAVDGNPADPSTGNVDVLFPTYSIKVTINDEQIKTLPTIYPLIIPAPGENKIIMVNYFLWYVDAAAGDYSNLENSDDSSIYLIYGEGYIDDASEAHDNIYPTFLGPMIYRVPGRGTLAVGSWVLSNIKNQGIYLYVENGSLGNITGGNPANTLTVEVSYSIVSV